MRCGKCNPRPELRETGWSGKGDMPDLRCPVCRQGYYTQQDGSITIEKRVRWPEQKEPKPFKWPDKKQKFNFSGKKQTI